MKETEKNYFSQIYCAQEAAKIMKKKGSGKILNLGLLKGTKGGQSYIIKEPIEKLSGYNSVVVYCKKFEVQFTYAALR